MGNQNTRFFEGQLVHAIVMIALIGVLYLAAGLPGFHDGRFLGLSTDQWVILAAGNAVIHQVYVWICWRLELDGKRLSKLIGARSFLIYKMIFTILIVLRPVIAFCLGWANRETLPIGPWTGYVVSLLLLGPVIFLIYSIINYFSFDRAFGIDHFEDEYRGAALVRRGIFSWTPNAMYVFGFMALWIPAFLFQSVAALVVAGFSHAYIWVHYYCTELPDMRRIYGKSPERPLKKSPNKRPGDKRVK